MDSIRHPSDKPERDAAKRAQKTAAVRRGAWYLVAECETVGCDWHVDEMADCGRRLGSVRDSARRHAATNDHIVRSALTRVTHYGGEPKPDRFADARMVTLSDIRAQP